VPRFRSHIFVCTNERPVAGKPSCGARNGAQLLSALQVAIAANPDLRADVAVTGCGCLGPCFDGPNVVVYPEGTWYAGVSLRDADEIVASLVDGRIVDRLVYVWPDDDDEEDE
jgi:(2Fe-2S) ferredoxin